MPSQMNPDLSSLWEALDQQTKDYILVTPTEELDDVPGDERCEGRCGAADAQDDRYNLDDELVKQDLRRAMEMHRRKSNDVRNIYALRDPFDGTTPPPHSSTAIDAMSTSMSLMGGQDPATTSLATSPTPSDYQPTTEISGSQPTPTSALYPDPPAANSTVSPTSTETSSSDGGLSTSAKIGLGVGLGVGIPLLVALLGCFIVSRRRKRAHLGAGGKYTPHANSDLSMIESPVPTPAPQMREVPEVDYYEPPKSFEPATYHAFTPGQDYEHFETPVSAVTPLEPQSARSFPASPPPLVIPTAEEAPRQSLEPPLEREVSPVSPVSPVSALSSLDSRPPSPRHHEQ